MKNEVNWLCNICQKLYPQSDFVFIKDFKWNNLKCSGYVCKQCEKNVKKNLTGKQLLVLSIAVLLFINILRWIGV
jgi:hypothetical protein